MSGNNSDQYEGIRKALKLAKYTGQTVNVGLNRNGEGVKVEGVIEKVYPNKFVIHLEEDVLTQLTGKCVQTIPITEVEYVEYS